MTGFPTELLKPQTGIFLGDAGHRELIIPLAPFAFASLGSVETELRITWPAKLATAPATLAGRMFEFPVNPEPGYIDASIYLDGAHHPVDIHAIHFGAASATTISASFKTMLILGFEGLRPYEDTPWHFDAVVKFPE